VFSAGDWKAADARGRQLTKGGFLHAEWIRQSAPVVMGNRVAVSLDLFPALPSALALVLQKRAPFPLTTAECREPRHLVRCIGI
jgi:hypothetical protein